MLNAKYTTTSTKEPDEESPGLIFPNPADDFIEINVPRWRGQGVDLPPLERGSGGMSIRIYDVLGVEQFTLTPTLSLKGEGVRIDVSLLAPGVYFVRVGDMVRKFVKY